MQPLRTSPWFPRIAAYLRMNPILRTALGVVVGAALGFAYQRVVGCRTGTCLITARWWTATLYGAIVGLLASGGAR